MTKSKLGKKGFIWLTFANCSSSLKDVRTGTKAGQEPGGRNWNRGHGGVQLTGLHPMACSACFLIEPSTTSPGMEPTTIRWALLHQSPKKKKKKKKKKKPALQACYSQILYRHFLNWGFLSSDFSLCRVHIKDTQHTRYQVWGGGVFIIQHPAGHLKMHGLYSKQSTET